MFQYCVVCTYFVLHQTNMQIYIYVCILHHANASPETQFVCYSDLKKCLKQCCVAFYFKLGKKGPVGLKSQIVHCLSLPTCDFCVFPYVAEVLLRCRNTCLMHFMRFKVESCGNKATQIKGHISWYQQIIMT